MAFDAAPARPLVTAPNAALAACTGAYFAVRFAQLLVSPAVPAIIDDFDTSRGAVGAALSGMWVAYACSQIPSGVLADRFGGRAVVLVSLVATAAAALALAAAPSLPLFVAAVVVLGGSAGLYYNAATALLSIEFDAIGRAIGVHRIGGQVAGVTAPVVAAAVGLRFGWRGVLAIGGVTALVVFVGVRRGVRRDDPVRPDAAAAELFAPATLLGFLSRPPLLYTTALAALCEFALLATVSFLPTLLVERHGLSLARASLLFSAYFAVVALCQPVAGWLSDRAGRDRTLAAMFVAGIAGYAALGVASSVLGASVAVVLVGVAMCWGPPLQSRAVDRLAPDERGAGFGVVRAGYILAGAPGAAVVGALADAVGWGGSALLLAGLFGVAAAATAVNRLSGLGL